ncbi:hypothetical protein TrRE_jg11702 [Triparma retinervis]|uniref:Uncharacterized protein n=1 Tax=Triparma retinervis TaxID=2557542 RepID=A0A9W6Z6F2_9STRA|nr:hypothetical protein TrRE_jg11702 [Triparma retinervis]
MATAVVRSLGVFGKVSEDFKAGLGIGITQEEEQAALQAKSSASKGGSETGTGVDYSATGALKTFPTRQGMKNSFDTEEIDQMPTNLDEQAVAAILAAKESEEGHHGGNLAAESVDALRTFKTRKGAKYEWETEEIDQTPGQRQDDDDDEDDDE